MFPLKKCCYVLPLKKGIIILGIMDLILLEILDSAELLGILFILIYDLFNLLML